MHEDFRLSGRLVRPRLNAIDYEENTIHLQPKVMQVLVALAGHVGDVVTRQQLREIVWPDVFVGEDVLVRAISELRRAFQDDPQSQHTIQTIPKVGYRLVAPVEIVESAALDTVQALDELPEASHSFPKNTEDPGKLEEPRNRWMKRWQAEALVGGVLVLLFVAIMWFWSMNRQHEKIEAQEAPVASAPADQANAYRVQTVAPVPGGYSILSGATYEIENKKSGLVLEVPVSSASNGTLLDQWKSNGGNNQRWVVEANGPYWTFTNVASGKLLDDPSANRALGVQLDQWQANHAPNQNWIVIPAGDKSCKIISQASGLLLDVSQGSTSNGTSIIQYTDNDGANQHWILRRVNKPTKVPDSH
jgi:DNA-binding winged helix-turn-helix (wHTH) protein